MADQKTTDAAIAGLIVTYYEKMGLERLLPKLRFYNHADKKSLPARSGKTVQWYRFRTQTAVTTNMTELSTPTQVYLSADTISATLIQRGAYVRISDLLSMTSISPILEDAATQMGEKAARTVDTYIRNEIGFLVAPIQSRSAYTHALNSSGTAARIMSGTSAGEGFALLQNKVRIATSALVVELTTSGLTVRTCQHAAMTLRNNNVDPFDDGYYIGIIHPKAAYDVMTAAGWKGWQTYTNPELMYRGEIGKIGGIRFVESSDAPAFDLSGDTLQTNSGSMFGTIIFGPHAYGATELAGKGNKQKGYSLIIKQLGSAGTADPVNQTATAGFKITMAAKILNKSAGVILLSNTTA